MWRPRWPRGWSPENEGGERIGGATGPAVGAKLRGSNRHDKKSWKAVATVTEAEPGRRFSLQVKTMVIPISEWCYEIEPTDVGCRVTESWTDMRPGFFRPIAAMATGVSEREDYTRAGIEQTLERLAAVAAEADPG